jgi:hypothetical protein
LINKCGSRLSDGKQLFIQPALLDIMANASEGEGLEGWLTSTLKQHYPLTDDWVVEGVSSATLSSDDKRTALDTIASFLGHHDELGNVVDELFRRTGSTSSKDLSVKYPTRAVVQGKPGKSKTLATASPATAPEPSYKPLQPKDLNRRVVNCLKCGKIFDCRPKDGVLAETAKAFLESSGECTFCGARVALELSHEDAAGGSGGELAKMTSHYEEDCGVSSQEAAAKAKDAKDRLVEFDRTAASRTVVIDDQSDWFEIDGNAWLDESERVELKKQAAVGR